MLERFFELRKNGTHAVTEMRAGLVTFLTMAYILFVNPQILSASGMPAEDVVLATALSAALATLTMALYARLPFALAPGMGLNAYFAFGVVGALGISWQVALAAIFIEGLLFLALSWSGWRSALLAAIPETIKIAATAGIGLFLALIGFQNAGLVRDHPETLITLGDLGQIGPVLALAGLLGGAILAQRRVPGSLLWVIASLALVAWGSGLSPAPERIFTWPSLPRETFLALDFSTIWTGELIPVILAFLFVDLLDTAGTLLGVGRLAGKIDANGELIRADRAFTADAVGTTVGALLGTSTVTTYIESATGVEEGGRTGLTALTTAVLFLLALFLTPLFIAVPALATAPALILVGAMMMRGMADIDWKRSDEAIPAFLTITLMPFTYSIANGLAFGIVSWVLIKLFAGRRHQISRLMYALAVALTLFYLFIHPS